MSQSFISRDQLIQQCPLVLGNPSNDVSNKYVHIPTIKVVDDIMSHGWQPVKAQGRRPMDVENPSRFSKHSVTFSRPELQFGVGNAIDTVIPTITLINSHDGLNSFKFFGGLFRLVCTNGLVVPALINGKKAGASFKIRHIHYNLDSLTETLDTTLKSLQESVKIVYDLSDRIMSLEERRLFAKRGMLRRMRVTSAKVEQMLSSIPDETADSLLLSNRREDEGNNAWLVLNTIQENLIKGTPHFFNPEKKRIEVLKGINSFERNLEINVGLFEDVNLILN